MKSVWHMLWECYMDAGDESARCSWTLQEKEVSMLSIENNIYYIIYWEILDMAADCIITTRTLFTESHMQQHLHGVINMDRAMN